MKCPSFETLLNYTENTLPAQARAEVAQHLAGPCVPCQITLYRVRVMLDTLAHDDTVAPPPQVVRRAIALFRPGNSASGAAPRPRILPHDPFLGGGRLCKGNSHPPWNG